MIPILLITDSNKIIKKYLKNLIIKTDILFEIKPLEKEFSISQIKDLNSETKIFNKNKRVYLLENFHLSSLEAQNSFLKLLEEPPNNVLFIITTNNEEKIIPTIRSRVKIVYLSKKSLPVLSNENKDLLNEFISSKSFKLINTPIKFEELISFFRERLQTDKKSVLIIKEILKTKTLIENNNLNAQLALDHILIFIKKQYTIK